MITVYGSPTTRAFRILWLLEELSGPIHIVDRLIFGPVSIEVIGLELNPHGKVPVIDIDGVVLFKSAIVTPLVRALPLTKRTDASLRTSVDLTFLNGCTLRWQKWMRPCGRLPSTSLPTPRNSGGRADGEPSATL